MATARTCYCIDRIGRWFIRKLRFDLFKEAMYNFRLMFLKMHGARGYQLSSTLTLYSFLTNGICIIVCVVRFLISSYFYKKTFCYIESNP